MNAIVGQDTDGNSYLLPELTFNAGQATLEAKPIQTLTFNSVSTGATAGLHGDRYAGDFSSPSGAVDGTGGADVMNAGFIDVDGDQILASGVQIAGGAGNDSITDGAGNDTIFGGSGADRATLTSGGGDDFVSGIETVYVQGDAGNDTLISNEGNGLVGLDEGINLNFTSGDSAVSSDGTYTLNVTGFYSFDAYGTTNVFDASNAGQWISYFSYGGNHTLTGSDFSDTFMDLGSGGAINLDAGDGQDYVEGGSGNDTLLGGNGDDTIFGEAGDDWIEAGNNNGGGDFLDGCD